MGGDTFEGVEKLTNAEYQAITKELLQRLAHICQRIEPYTPLPEKQIHGDVDLVVIFRKGFTAQHIIEQLKLQTYKLAKQSMNSVFRKKQVDFIFAADEKEFQLVLFYKSYSGFGGYLGTFFPSRLIKVTHKGLYITSIYHHLKLQFLISDDVPKIMEFYGLSYERHKQGYKTRKQLYEYLREVRFLDQDKYVEEVKQVKGTSKLMWGMVQYLREVKTKKEKEIVTLKEPVKQALEFFGKTKQYDQAYDKMVAKHTRNQLLNKKFNATHLLAHFQIVPMKKVDHLKRDFHAKQFENDQQKYYDFVESHSLQEILNEFEKMFGLTKKSKQIQETQKQAIVIEKMEK